MNRALRRLPPLRFRPLRRLPGGGQPLVPGVPALGSVASSAFLTLSRPYSARHLPALFHAGAVLGVVPFRVDPTRRAGCPLGPPFPLVVEPERRALRASRCEPTAWERSVPVRGGVDRKTPSRPALHFRALIPASVRTRRWRFRPADGPRPSWGSSSLGGSPSPPEANPEAYPLSSFTTAAHARAAAAPQSLAGEEIGWTPSSLPPLPRFLHLVDEPSSTRRD